MSLDENSIELLLLGSVLTLFISWFVAWYTWRAQRTDERRKKVYAPLYDEIRYLKTRLEQYGPFVPNSYKEISSAHLLYSVPDRLEKQIRELYDEKLPLIDSMKANLYQKYVPQILERMNKEFAYNVSSDNTADALAKDLAIYVFESKIDQGRKSSFETAFRGLNQRYQKTGETTLDEFFREFLKSASKDEDHIKLTRLIEETRRLMNSLQNALKADLRF